MKGMTPDNLAHVLSGDQEACLFKKKKSDSSPCLLFWLNLDEFFLVIHKLKDSASLLTRFAGNVVILTRSSKEAGKLLI